MDIVDLTSCFAQSSSTAEDGKTVIQNRPSGGFIVETIDSHIITAEDANRSAAAGGTTHGFFYRGTDFLLDAAREYATLGENEVFQYRNIADVNFVRDVLDFFTGGNYSQSDVNAVQEQMTEVVRELARQIKNGEAPDLGKLQSKLTIGGADVTISQLMDIRTWDWLERRTISRSSFGIGRRGSESAHSSISRYRIIRSGALKNCFVT